MNVYPFIEAEKQGGQHVKRACELLRVSRAAYYADRADQPGARHREDAELTELITKVHQESKRRYGAPHIHAELRHRGHRHGRKRIARLMRAAGVRGGAPKRWKKTTIPDPATPTRADLICRDFSTNAAHINTRWCGDITYRTPPRAGCFWLPSWILPLAGWSGSPSPTTCALSWPPTRWPTPVSYTHLTLPTNREV